MIDSLDYLKFVTSFRGPYSIFDQSSTVKKYKDKKLIFEYSNFKILVLFTGYSDQISDLTDRIYRYHCNINHIEFDESKMYEAEVKETGIKLSKARKSLNGVYKWNENVLSKVY